MKINLSDGNFLTDNSSECQTGAFFVKSAPNARFEADALARGAVVISPKKAAQMLGVSRVKLVGITGTNGKTTVAAAVAWTLNSLGVKCGLSGTRGAWLGSEKIAPKGLTTSQILETLSYLKLAAERGFEAFVMEVSSHAIALGRIEGLEFAVKVFTNLTQDHLDFHKTLDEYARVKSSFFDDDSVKLINLDDGGGLCFCEKNAHFYGLQKEDSKAFGEACGEVKSGDKNKEKVAEFYATEADFSEAIKAKICGENFESKMQGEFNLYNVLAAFGATNLLLAQLAKSGKCEESKERKESCETPCENERETEKACETQNANEKAKEPLNIAQYERETLCENERETEKACETSKKSEAQNQTTKSENKSKFECGETECETQNEVQICVATSKNKNESCAKNYETQNAKNETDKEAKNQNNATQNSTQNSTQNYANSTKTDYTKNKKMDTITHKNILEALAKFEGVEGRVEVVSREPLVVVDFAHTPDGIEKVLSAFKGRDVVAVFGAGGDRDRTKRPKMGEVAERLAKFVVVTSDNPRSENPHAIIEEILAGMRKKPFVEADRRKAIELALSLAKEGEVVAILGKGDEDYQEICGVKHHFCDKEVVKQILEQGHKI